MLQQILFTVPDCAVPAVQRAIVHVARGDWRMAAKAMWEAADDCLDTESDAWKACDTAAETLFKKG